MEIQLTEHNKLIATRVPPGDKWVLVDDKKKVVHDTLTDALEAHFKNTGTACEFRLAPLDSKEILDKVHSNLFSQNNFRIFTL